MKQPIKAQIVRPKQDMPAGEDTRPKDWVKLGLSPSTEVEDWPIGGKPVTQNQCDGCIRGIPVVNGIHRDAQYFGMVCSKSRYGVSHD